MDLLSAMFLVEAKECLQGIEEELPTLANRSSRQKVFRAVHSIKGAAGCLGFFKILSVAQALEGLLGLLREGALEWSPRVSSTLRVGIERLAHLIDCAPTSNEINVAGVLAEFEELFGKVQGERASHPVVGK